MARLAAHRKYVCWQKRKGHQYILTTLLKKLPSKVDGFTFVHFCLKVITSDVKVLYDLLMLYVRRYYLLREVAWHSNLLANQPSVNIGYLLPIYSAVVGKEFGLELVFGMPKLTPSPEEKLMLKVKFHGWDSMGLQTSQFPFLHFAYL